RRRFRHALMRDAAYEGLTYKRRQELHSLVAEALVRFAQESTEDFAELLSLHYFSAQRYQEAGLHSRIAGDRANAKYANAEAITFYTRAIGSARHLHAPAEEISALIELL